MSNTSNFAERMSSGIIACLLVLMLAVGLAGCSSSSDSSGSTSTSTEEETTESASGSALAAPTDLDIDFSTGDFTFTSNDEGVSYYFLRVYSYEDGVVGDEYIATSSRITGNTTGTLSGSLDLSDLGWSTYQFVLSGFAASGSDDEDPETIEIVYQLGVGGVMERPELMVLADGNTAEFYIDLYTLSDWNAYQVMPVVEFNIYSDADCTEVVATEQVDLSTLEPVAETVWSAGSTYWTLDSEATHLYLQPAEGDDSTTASGLVSQLVVDDLDAGTYYVTATALGTDDGLISDSQVSDAVEFTVTADAATGDYTATYSSLWQDPNLTSFGAEATEGTYTDRVDYAVDQTTEGEVVEE